MIQSRLNLVALLCLLAVAFALVSQHVFDMPPCAWCVLQRLILLCIALLCLLANLVTAQGIKRCVALLASLLSIAGIVAAWYQHTVASEMVSCDRTFADIFMSKTTGLDAVAPWIFGIYATCMDAKVSLLGIEYVLWALALFVLLLVVCLSALFKKSRARFH